MNKLIVVTGGTRGIGRAILEKFAGEGFDVATCSRSGSELGSLKEVLQRVYSINAHVQTTDMSKKEEVKAFARFVAGLNRPVDVLVNNAGYFVPGLITEEPDGSLENTIDSNVYSAYYMARGLVPAMKERKSGHIFNMCSIASVKPPPRSGAYAISKFALLGFSKVLRDELKDYGIRVTAIMPGATKTDSWKGSDLPEERFMKVEDVADAVYAAYALSGRSVVEEMVIRPMLGDI